MKDNIAQLLQSYESQLRQSIVIRDYDTLIQSVIDAEHRDEITALNKLISQWTSDDHFKEQFKSFCVERKRNNRNTLLSATASPDTPCNKMYAALWDIIFPGEPEDLCFKGENAETRTLPKAVKMEQLETINPQTFEDYLQLFKNLPPKEYTDLLRSIKVNPPLLINLHHILEGSVLNEKHAFQEAIKHNPLIMAYQFLKNPGSLPSSTKLDPSGLSDEQCTTLVTSLSETSEFWDPKKVEYRHQIITRSIEFLGLSKVLATQYTDGNSLLHKISIAGDAIMLLLLIDHLPLEDKKNNLSNKNKEGLSSLQTASLHDASQCVNIIINQLSSHTREARQLILDQRLLEIAIEHNALETLNVLGLHLKVDALELYTFLTKKNHQGNSLLSISIKHNRPEILKRLAKKLTYEEKLAALDEKMPSDERLYEFAAKNGLHAIIQVMLDELGLPLEKFTAQNLRIGLSGLSGLHLAAQATQGSEETVSIILSKAPSDQLAETLLEKNIEDQCLLDIAAEKNNIVFNRIIDITTEPVLFELLRDARLLEKTRAALFRSTQEKHPTLKIRFLIFIFEDYLKNGPFFSFFRTHTQEAEKIIAALQACLHNKTNPERTPTKFIPNPKNSPVDFFKAVKSQRSPQHPPDQDENTTPLKAITDNITSKNPNEEGEFFKCCKLALSVLEQPPTEIYELFKGSAARKLEFK